MWRGTDRALLHSFCVSDCPFRWRPAWPWPCICRSQTRPQTVTAWSVRAGLGKHKQAAEASRLGSGKHLAQPGEAGRAFWRRRHVTDEKE